MRALLALAAACVAAVMVALLAGCGGSPAGAAAGPEASAPVVATGPVGGGSITTNPHAGHTGTTPATGVSAMPGRGVFLSAQCGACHVLADAGATGTVGPDLDARKPTAAAVARQVTRGGGVMPSFAGRLSPTEIRQVAAYVAAAAKGSGVPVVGRFKPDGRTVADCQASDFPCYEQAFGNLVYRQGPKSGLADLQARMTSDSTVNANCHRIAHAMGAAGLLWAKGRVGVAMAAGSAVCASGFYHGVLERALATVPDKKLGRYVRTVCTGPAVTRVQFVAYQCVHGLGHGLMLHMGYDLPSALKVCDKLATPWDRSSCTGGVFMENIASSYGITSKWLKDGDLIYPCNAVAARHKLYCYLMATSRILPKVNYDWDEAARICRTAEAGWVTTCFQSYGRDASGMSLQQAEGILGICPKAGDMEAECIHGAARDVANSNADGERAARLCDAVREGLRRYCYWGVGTILGTLHNTQADRARACRALSAAYGRDCLAGASGGQAPATTAA